MRQILPDGIARIDTVDGVRYVLPGRPLGKGWIVTFILLVVGAGLIAFTAFWVRGPIASLRASDTVGMIFGLMFIVAGMVPALVRLGCLGVAVVLALGRNQVVLRDDWILAIDRLGPLRWTRKRTRRDITHLEVNTGAVSTNDGPQRPTENFAVLLAMPDEQTVQAAIEARRAQDKEAKSLGRCREEKVRFPGFILAWGYPRVWLLELADILAQDLRIDRSARLTNHHEAAVAVTERLGGLDDLEDEPESDGLKEPPPQPADSQIILDRHDAGITLTIPPAGIWKGSKGLFSFALIWCGFMGTVTIVVAVAPADDFKNNPLIGILIMAALWGIGLGILIGAINMGRRRAILDVVGFLPDGTLLITRRNIFGTKQRELHRQDIAAIRMDNSGMEVNEMPVKNLQVHPKQGRKLGLFAGRDDAELEWLAAELRNALDVPRRQ